MSKALNILFLMTDQLRDDCVGYASGSKVKTPNIDRLAEGHHFSRCQSVNPICQPARTALLTGKYSHQIGTLAMSGDLDFRHPTHPQALQKAGYWTAGVGKFHYLQSWPWSAPRGEGINLTEQRDVMRQIGYDHVWETSGKQLAIKNFCDYCAHLKEHGILEQYRDYAEDCGSNYPLPNPDLAKDGRPWPFAEEHHIDILTGQKIREAIEQRPTDKPFYILGSFCSPHKPFDPPQRFLERVPYEEVDDFIPGEKVLSEEEKNILWKLRRAYKALIHLVDDEIGKILALLQEKNLMDNTLIILSSDHGELMGDHYRVQKSSYWRGSLQVPLVIRHPHFLAAEENSSPVELTDITATILEAAGLNPQEALSRPFPAFNDTVPCRSLLPIIQGKQAAVRDFAFSEWANHWQCIVSNRYKYVRHLGHVDPDIIKEELYDTDEDPSEQTNLIRQASHQAIADWHRRRLWHTMDKTPPAQQVWAPLMDKN